MKLAAALVLALVVPGHAYAACKTIVVTKAAVSYPHASTIQAGVNRARPCDWVLVAPGRYPEKVVVTTPHLHLRGLNRNTVVVDGLHHVGHGIVVDKASDVWIENLTVRNWDRKSRDDEESGGNEIWFNGGDETGKIGASGWHGNWLTAYDTGLLGGYGIFASNSVNGEFDHIYASGFNDSGVYIGACPDCHATVSRALVERNALGFSGTNAGGHLVVQDSVFRLNAVGVGPNSLPNDEPAASARHLRLGNEHLADADDHDHEARPLHDLPPKRDREQQQPHDSREQHLAAAAVGSRARAGWHVRRSVHRQRDLR